MCVGPHEEVLTNIRYSYVMVAVVSYMYTGDLSLDQFSSKRLLAADLLDAESLLGLEDAQLRTCTEDILLRDLEQEAGLEQILELWNLAVLHNLPRLMEAIYQLLDLRLETFVLEASSRSHLARLGFEVRCVRYGQVLES